MQCKVKYSEVRSTFTLRKKIEEKLRFMDVIHFVAHFLHIVTVISYTFISPDSMLRSLGFNLGWKIQKPKWHNPCILDPSKIVDSGKHNFTNPFLEGVRMHGTVCLRKSVIIHHWLFSSVR